MGKRQLSAIMFTDLAGYTAMMQEDEINAKGLRDRHRKILEREISGHDGKILQYYGDGALSVFNSTISAASSAVSIQKESISDKIPLRIGIHTGDVVIEEDGVYGDGVNIASRIESFATSGSVMISDKVYDDLKNHPSFQPSLMGEFELKNVKRPVEVYALTNDGLIVPQRTELKGKVKERIKSIAVLPFINRSADPENEYFSDGITEEIITALAKVEGIKVISRTSSFAFKGKNMDVREIGKQLEVQSILEGSVRKSGKKVRISAQLSSTFDGYELWTETYDRLLEDIFEVQDEISLKISHQLKEKLTSSSLDSTEKTKNVEIEAYNSYLQGLFYYNKWTPDNAAKATNAFKHAIAIQPDYDQAYAGLALAYSLMSFTGFLKPGEGYLLTEQSANKALELNDQCENAYLALSYVQFFYHWDFEKARNFSNKALDINPRSPDANLTSSLYPMVFGKLDEALLFIEKTREIDPLSSLTNRTLADAYYLKGDYKMAVEVYDWLLEQDPEFMPAFEFKGWAYLMNGDYDEAIRIFEAIGGEEALHSIKPFVQLGYAYALKGDTEVALVYLDELKKDADANPDGAFELSFATLYSGLGMIDEAFQYLEKVLDLKLGAAVMIKSSPIWEPLRSDPRFEALLKRVGIY
ncbi:MAG: adenylate/guanylate cyclase domain-containing protein [Cyclobacteriaceae bacterium]